MADAQGVVYYGPEIRCEVNRCKGMLALTKRFHRWVFGVLLELTCPLCEHRFWISRRSLRLVHTEAPKAIPWEEVDSIVRAIH